VHFLLTARNVFPDLRVIMLVVKQAVLEKRKFAVQKTLTVRK